MASFLKRKEPSSGFPSVEVLYKRNHQTNYSNAGGFMADDDEDGEQEAESSSKTHVRDRQTEIENLINWQDTTTKYGDNGLPLCKVCEEQVPFSYLMEHFGFAVCDQCKPKSDGFKLITRTEAKSQYLLKDCDLDVRTPKLPFILKKNPHNPRWGDMKLYLKIQVQGRAIEVWESLEAIEEARKKRESNRKDRNQKQMEKNIKTLRKQVRGGDRPTAKKAVAHEHSFGKEQHDANRDVYYQICTDCKYHLEFEKM